MAGPMMLAIATIPLVGPRVHEFGEVGGQASRVAVFQAPMAVQPMIQAMMTTIMAHVGMGDRMIDSRDLDDR
jgi:hypothetical protein